MANRVGVDKERLRYAAEVAEEAVKSGAQNCAVIAVANRADTLWTQVVSGEDRVGLDTIFLLASISKSITACAVMRLVEQGKLLLNRPVAAYLPEFAKNGKQHITAFHLLTHTNGMDETRWAQARFSDEADIGTCFEEACETTLTFAPGSDMAYRTLSFAVLSELITRLSGQPYPEYLQEHVFAPLGMRDTAFRPTDPKRAAPVHNFGEPGRLERFMERAIAGGGMWSTAADLIALGQTLLNGGKHGGYTLLGPATIETMTHLQASGMVDWGDGIPASFNYALGWGKGSHVPGAFGSPNAYEHGGATGTRLWIDPEWDLIFVYLTNTWGDETETARRLLNAVYGALTI